MQYSTQAELDKLSNLIKTSVGDAVTECKENFITRDQTLTLLREVKDRELPTLSSVGFDGKSWTQKGNGRWESTIRFENILKGLNDHNAPKGSGVFSARAGTIWQEKPEDFRWGDMIPRITLSGTDNPGIDGTAKSLQISGLAHGAVADGSDATTSGTSAETSHTLQTRKSLVKLSTSLLQDVPSLTSELERLIAEIVDNEMAKSCVAALHDQGSKILTGVADNIPTTGNVAGRLINMTTAMSAPYRRDSQFIMHTGIFNQLMSWASANTSNRWTGTILGSTPETMLLNRPNFVSALLEAGTTADDQSCYLFNPSVLRIFTSPMVSSSLTLGADTDAYFLAVRSRWVIVALDGNGIVRLETEADPS